MNRPQRARKFLFLCTTVGLWGCDARSEVQDEPSASAGTAGVSSGGGGGGGTAAAGTSGASPGGSVSTGGGGAAMGGSNSGGQATGGVSQGGGGGGTVPVTCDQGEGGALYEAPLGSGTPGQWQQITMPVGFTYAMSVVADPVRINEFYGFLTSGAGTDIHVVKSTDYGATWTSTNNTNMVGDPWGATIDPNPCRDPETPPTMYTPAGYGSNGVFKSVDGGVTWTQLFTGSNVFSAYTPYGSIPDTYSVVVLPDNPPQHLLMTFHGHWVDPSNGQKNTNIDAGFGESTDGGQSWMVHPGPSGIGTSQYLMIVDQNTWLSISQDGDSNGGIWKTSTAGRVDGAISTAAWKKVDPLTHVHGCFNAAVMPGAIYAPGSTGIKRSTDAGETWNMVLNATMTHMVATPNFLYADNLPNANLVRSAIGDGAMWDSYCAEPSGIDNGQIGPGTQTTITASDGAHSYIVNFNNSGGVWRYVE